SGPQSAHDRNFDDLVALMMLQQLISNSPQNNTASKQISEEAKKRREGIEKTQKEVLDLLATD
ncbi:MAG: hypothetical protein ACFE8G_15395, partial [Candidatus Hermodarchaeota archaeon]